MTQSPIDTYITLTHNPSLCYNANVLHCRNLKRIYLLIHHIDVCMVCTVCIVWLVVTKVCMIERSDVSVFVRLILFLYL